MESCFGTLKTELEMKRLQPPLRAPAHCAAYPD
jgi:hypothetical protein